MVSLTSEQGEGVACTVIPYGPTVDTVDFEVLLVICYLLSYSEKNHLSQWRVQKRLRCLDIWKVTCLQAAEHPVDIGMYGLCDPGRTFIQLACKGMMLRRITEHPTVVTLHWDLFFFQLFDSSMQIWVNTKLRAQSENKKGRGEGGEVEVGGGS